MYSQYSEMANDLKGVLEGLGDRLRALADSSVKHIESSRQRNALAENTISRCLEMLAFTPESKGILIYLLTRHSKWDVLDPDNRGVGVTLDIYQRRNEAVVWVLRSIQTLAEWRKVLCRVTVDGHSRASNGDEAIIEEKQERGLVEFLQLGLNRDDDLRKAKDELYSVRQCIRAESNVGYALTMNNTEYYRLNSGINPSFPGRCDFGLGCREVDFRWS